MSYVIIAIVNEMMYRSLHLAYWQWWRGGWPQMPGEACCLTSQEALTCTQHRDKATRSMFQPSLLNEGPSLPKASEMSLSRFRLRESVEWGMGMSQRVMQNAGCLKKKNAGCYHLRTAQKPWLQTQRSFISNEENACLVNKIVFVLFKPSEFLVLSQTQWRLVLVRWKKLLVAQSCLTLCDPMQCSLPDFSVHGVPQAIILETVAILFSRISSTQGSNLGLLHCRPILYLWATRHGRTIKQRG